MNRNHLDPISGRRDRNCCIMENLRYLNSTANETKQCGTRRKSFKAKHKPRQKHIIHLLFLYKRLTSTKFVRLELSEKTLPLSKDGDVFCVFAFTFLLRTNDKKVHLDKNDFCHCYGNYFRKCCSESYLITAMFEVPSQQLRGILATTFWKTPYTRRFNGHDSRCYFFYKHPEAKIGEGACKIIDGTKIQACTSKNIVPK